MEVILELISMGFQFAWNHMFVINMLLAIIIVFFERRDPKTIWTWLLVLYFLPVLGFLIYLLFGQDMRRSKRFMNMVLEDAVLAAVHKQEQKVKAKEIFCADTRGMAR